VSQEALGHFATKRDELLAMLEAQASLLDGAPIDLGVSEGLRRAAERVRADVFRIVLIGAFSTGKSTLLNALIGQSVLPAKVNPCTAIATEVHFAPEPGATVVHGDGTTRELSLEAFRERFHLMASDLAEAGQEARDRFGGLAYARVALPLPLVSRGVVLIDTPGLDDDPQRTARTMATLHDADAVVVVLNALRFLGDLERRVLREHIRPLGLDTLFFPVTMADLVPRVSLEPEAEMARIRTLAARELAPAQGGGEQAVLARLFPLDARGALHAREADSDPPGAFLAFEQALSEFLVHGRGEAQLERLRGLSRYAADELTRHAAIDRASQDASAEELRARHAALTPRFTELERLASRVEYLLDSFIAEEKSRIWLDLRDYLIRCQEELPRAVETLELPGLAGVELLTSAGRARAERELQAALEDWFQQRLEHWRVQLEPKLASRLTSLREDLALEAKAFSAVSSDILAQFAGTPVSLPRAMASEPEPDPLERWFSVAVGAALLSPGTVAAAWTDGYEGALKGAAGRLVARLAVLAASALVGPVGWAGIGLYAAVDLVVVLRTGGGKLRHLRRTFADQIGDSMITHADSQREAIEAQVEQGLSPLRTQVLATARAEVDELSALLHRITEARQAARDDAQTRDAEWARLEAAMALLVDPSAAT
jgi:hypothetical protein